jgi:hypothetical protein
VRIRPITRIVSAAELPAPQLGRILIAAGLLNEEQLGQALEEQAQTGRRLGEIIVQRGFISGPALANALAEQHGGVLKTEYGFASGLGGVVARRAAAESGTPVSPLRPPDPTPMPTLRTAEPEESSESPMPTLRAAEPEPEEPSEALAQQEAPEPPMPVEPEPEPQPDQPLEPPPLFRPAEPAAPASVEPAEEPTPPPAAFSPLSPPEPPELSSQPEPTVEAPEHSLEPVSKPLAEAAEPIPEPIALRPPDTEPVQQTPEVPSPEAELFRPSEPGPTAPTESVEPVPEPVELRRPAAEPVATEPEPEVVVRPEPEPAPAAEATEPLPEPVELRPPNPQLSHESVEPMAPQPEPMPPVEDVEPAPETVVETSPTEPAATTRDERDDLIGSLRARVEAQEVELASLREQLEQERSRKDVQVHVWPEEQAPAEPTGPVQAEQFLLCVPTSAGYVLIDRVGALPSVGQAVDVPEEEGRFTVTKVVRLPRNGRPCAYLQRA